MELCLLERSYAKYATTAANTLSILRKSRQDLIHCADCRYAVEQYVVNTDRPARLEQTSICMLTDVSPGVIDPTEMILDDHQFACIGSFKGSAIHWLHIMVRWDLHYMEYLLQLHIPRGFLL